MSSRRNGYSHLRMRNSALPQRSLLLSLTADYALRATLFLAQNTDRPFRAHEIADAIGAPRNYIAKTLNSLAKARVLSSLRGPHGGFSLANDPSELTVAAITGVFDGPEPVQKCLLHDRTCTPANPCVAHERWSEFPRAARHALATTTIADLLGRRTAAPKEA